jgi:phosphoribosylformylglycinamidine synthase subunit PurL
MGATVDLSEVGRAVPSAPLLGGDTEPYRLDALLFGETHSRVVITCKPLDVVKVVERTKLMRVPAAPIGKVGGDQLAVKTAAGEFSVPAAELHDVWWNSIARVMA